MLAQCHDDASRPHEVGHPAAADGRCRSLPMAAADRCRWPLPIVADGRCRSLPTRPRPTPVSRRARSARSNCRCADGRGPRATCRSRQQCYTAVIAAARSIAGRASQRLRTPLPPRVRDHEAHRGVPGDGAFIKTARPWHSATTTACRWPLWIGAHVDLARTAACAS